MIRFLREHNHAFLALVIAGLLVHFSENSSARASFDSDSGTNHAGLSAETLRTTARQLDRTLVGLFRVNNAIGSSVSLGIESTEAQQLERRIFDVQRTVSSALRSIPKSVSYLDQRIDRQRSFLGEIMTLVTERREMLANLPTSIPSIGRFSSEFGVRIHPVSGRRRMHTGIDIAAVTGTPIAAAAGGTIKFAGVKGGYGNCVIVDHGFGYSTLYGHASKLLVKEGDIIERGDEIALVGTTGVSTGPHLHFEVMVDGAKVDPVPFLANGNAPNNPFIVHAAHQQQEDAEIAHVHAH